MKRMLEDVKMLVVTGMSVAEPSDDGTTLVRELILLLVLRTLMSTTVDILCLYWHLITSW